MLNRILHSLFFLLLYSQVSDEAAHPSDARLAAPHSVARRSSVSSMPFSAPRFAALCFAKLVVTAVTHGAVHWGLCRIDALALRWVLAGLVIALCYLWAVIATCWLQIHRWSSRNTCGSNSLRSDCPKYCSVKLPSMCKKLIQLLCIE